MYKRGIVEEVDAATARVRVQFLEEQGLVSGWLEVLQGSACGDQDYCIPGVGNQVAVLLDENEEAGCVLGAIYSQADVPPVLIASSRVTRLADGFCLEYDQTSHVLKVTVPSGGTVELCGNSSAVALATKVQSELTALRSAYASHKHQAGTALLAPTGACTGITGVPVSVGYSVGSVGAAQVKSS